MVRQSVTSSADRDDQTQIAADQDEHRKEMPPDESKYTESHPTDPRHQDGVPVAFTSVDVSRDRQGIVEKDSIDPWKYDSKPNHPHSKVLPVNHRMLDLDVQLNGDEG